MSAHVDTWKGKRLNLRRRAAAQVIDSMAKGVALHLTFVKSGSRWTLSTGTPVASDVALAVVNDDRVVGEDDGLFKNGPGQTWRYVSTACDTNLICQPSK